MQFEELTAGRVIKAGPRVVTQQEIVEFAKLYDPQPFHVDAAAAAAGPWGGLIASGWMTCGIAMQLAAANILNGSTSCGSPGVNELKWLHPVRPGDALTLTVTILESRVSKSGRGIVRWRWDLHNQSDIHVLSMVAVSMFDITQPG